MKQAIKRVLFSLVLGFGVTWIMAWALAMIPHRYASTDFDFYHNSFPLHVDVDEPSKRFRHEEHVWLGVSEHRFYIRPRIDFSFRRIITTDKINPEWKFFANFNRFPPYVQQVADQLMKQYPDSRFPEEDSFYSVITYGFPFPSHIATGVMINQKQADGTYGHDAHGILIQRDHTPYYSDPNWSYPLAHSAHTPYAPYWTGMLYNTLFYALIFFIFTSTKRAFRHARRLRKGKCPICNYDLQYDNTLGCPECGWRKA